MAKPGINMKSFALLTVLCIEITQTSIIAAPIYASNPSNKSQSENGWFPHFQLGQTSLKEGDINTACKETDVVLKMADAQKNNLPPGQK